MMTEMIIIVVTSKSMREQIKLVRFTQLISPSSPTLNPLTRAGNTMVTTQLLTPHCRTLRGSVLWCHDNPMREKTCIRRRQARISLKVKHITLREDKDRWRTGCWVERWLMTFVCNAAELFGAASLWRHSPDTCGAHDTGENFLSLFSFQAKKMIS